MSTSKLCIDSQVDTDIKVLKLFLSGDIDVSAGSVFDTIPTVPAEHKVILDFEAVGRVNSMGLAQLLRCLENWKKEGVETEAINLNRMVSMLFKMTGLNRYFGATDNSGNVPVAPELTTASNTTSTKDSEIEKPKTPRNRSPQFRRVKRKRDNEETVGDTTTQTVSTTPEIATEPKSPAASLSFDDKMSFSVSLQHNQQLTGWYFLNTLLQRRIDRPVSMSINQLDSETALHENALVFAKPFEACSLMANHNYIPVARPIDDTVEVSIVVRDEDKEKAITDFSGASVATSTNASFVFLLGRFFCDEYELDSSKLHYQFTGNQLTAIRRLLDKDVDMLFMLKQNYHLLSELSRDGTHLLEESETGMAYHMLLLSPTYAALKPLVSEIFLGLQNDDQGLLALKDLGIASWCAPEADEIAMLQMLYQRYGTTTA